MPNDSTYIEEPRARAPLPDTTAERLKEQRARPARDIPFSAEAEALLLQAAQLLTDPSAFWQGGDDVALCAQHELFAIAAQIYNDLFQVLPAPPAEPPPPPPAAPPPAAPPLLPGSTAALAPPLGELLRDLAVQHSARVLTALHPHLIPAELDHLAQHRGVDAQLLPARLSFAARWLRAQLDWLTDYLTPGELAFQADADADAAANAAATATWAAHEARQIYVGAAAPPERWTHLGWRQPDGTPVALCREGGQVFFMAGAIGSGKSQALLSLIDGALTPQPGITSPTLPPTVAVAFHTDLTGVSLPELCSAVYPNSRQREVDFLWEHLRLPPRGLQRVRMLVPTTQLDEVQARARKALGPAASDGRLQILPLRLRLGDLGARGLEALLGIGPGESPRYLRTVLRVAAELGPKLTVADLEARLQGTPGLNATTRALALERLSILEHLEDPQASLWDLVEPGALTIINLSGAWLSRQHALPTLVALLNGLAQPSPRHGPVQRLFCLDEINRLEGEVTEWMHLVMLLRQIRHTGSSVVLSGQDFLNTPDEAFGQGTQFLCFRVMNPKVLEHLQRRVAGFAGLRAATLSALHPGHALWVPTECSDPGWRGAAQPVYVRPARCQHGGHTVAVL